jgi:hypothetical protein
MPQPLGRAKWLRSSSDCRRDFPVPSADDKSPAFNPPRVASRDAHTLAFPACLSSTAQSLADVAEDPGHAGCVRSAAVTLMFS